MLSVDWGNPRAPFKIRLPDCLLDFASIKHQTMLPDLPSLNPLKLTSEC